MNKKMVCLVMMVVIMLASITDQAGAVLSNEDFLPRQQASRVAVNQAIVYSVAEGDSLWAIAQRFHCDMYALMNLNGLDGNSVLKIGRQISIPNNRYGIHRISAGETLWDIARQNGISVEQLQRLNPGCDPSNLTIGKFLTVSAGRGQAVLAMNQSSRGAGDFGLILNWPIFGNITSYFGWRKLGHILGFHYGLDIAGKAGEPIKAAASGVVTYAGWKGNYGKAVVIEHGDGRETVYGHMQRILVHDGERVSRGKTIGLVGSTGHATGSHLHFEVRKNGSCYNPLRYLR